MKKAAILCLLMLLAAPTVAAADAPEQETPTAENNSTTTSEKTQWETASSERDQEPSNETPTESRETATETEENSTENSTVTVQKIGPNTRITDWSFSDGRYVITVEADMPVMLTISETPKDRSGSGTITFSRHSLSVGENRVVVDTVNGGPVVLTTPGSVQNDRGAYLNPNTMTLLEPPYRQSDIIEFGSGVAGGMSFFALLYAVAARIGAHRDPERIA